MVKKNSRVDDGSPSSDSGFNVFTQPVVLDADRPEVFPCSVDRAESVLYKHQQALRQKDAWLTPFTLFLTFLIALITAEKFRNILGLSPETWQAVFVVGAVVSFVWLIFSLVRAYKVRAVTVEALVRKLYSKRDD